MVGFKTERIMREYHQGIDQRLAAYLDRLDRYTLLRWNKSVMVTCLNRTPEENRAVGGVPFSSHIPILPNGERPKTEAEMARALGRGADIRTKDPVTGRWYFTPEQQEEIKNTLLEWLGPVFVFVKIEADHIHININYRERNTWA